MYFSLIVLPFVGCIVAGFFGRKVGAGGSQLITCMCVLTTTVLCIMSFVEIGSSIGSVSLGFFRWVESEWFKIVWSFQYDSLTGSMLIPVMIISSLVHIYSISYMSSDPHNPRFFSYLSLFTLMMVILVTSNNYLLMFVGWEGVGVCSYLLVSFWFTRIAANQSSISAFLTNRVGDCLLTIGMFSLLWSLGKKQILNLLLFFKSNVNQHTDISFIYSLCKRENTNNTKSLYINQILPYINPRYINNTQIRQYSSMGSYLAGLIEGDGHIAVQDLNTEKVVHRPKIIIAFNIHDKPLAEKISTQLNVGRVIDRSETGHVLLQILAKEEVLKIINLINGHMRTPKIEALHKAIDWINKKDNNTIPSLGLDKTPLSDNAWLAGFSDADGCFGITVYDRKKNGVFLRTSVQTSFRIEVKQNYSKEVALEYGGSSFFYIMSEISHFFTVNLYTRTRKTSGKVFYAFAVVAHNSKSHEILREYFSRFPLYSSKYLAYKDWCIVQDLHKGSLTKENLEKIKEIKNQFNSKRKVFDFSHLNNF